MTEGSDGLHEARSLAEAYIAANPVTPEETALDHKVYGHSIALDDCPTCQASIRIGDERRATREARWARDDTCTQRSDADPDLPQMIAGSHGR